MPVRPNRPRHQFEPDPGNLEGRVGRLRTSGKTFWQNQSRSSTLASSEGSRRNRSAAYSDSGEPAARTGHEEYDVRVHTGERLGLPGVLDKDRNDRIDPRIRSFQTNRVVFFWIAWFLFAITVRKL
jgi:hypothetical protein